jgi:hypothetical protein
VEATGQGRSGAAVVEAGSCGGSTLVETTGGVTGPGCWLVQQLVEMAGGGVGSGSNARWRRAHAAAVRRGVVAAVAKNGMPDERNW